MKIARALSIKNRALLRELVITNFKLRYQDSVLGYAWSLLRPLFLFAIIYTVFEKFLGIGRGIEHFPVYLLLGINMWSFFAEATKQGMSAIVSRGSLIRKVNFPKYIIVISATFSALINFLLNLIIIAFFIFINDISLGLNALLLPLLITELYLFALAVSFFLSALYVKYRDIVHLWDVFLQAGLYATPIIYPLSRVTEKYPELGNIMLSFNPVAQIIQDARYILVTDTTSTLSTLNAGLIYRIIPFLIIAILGLVSVLYFRKNSKYFAERI